MICHDEKGTTSAFRCLYHGWTFKNNGEILGVPYKKGYEGCFDKEIFSMHSLPRVESYRGFVFASMSEKGIDLCEYLGKGKEAIDRLCDLSPEGEIELTGGWLKHKVNANWKIIYENEFDGYHPNFVHQSMEKLKNWSLVTEAHAFSERSATQIRYLGNGHADVNYLPQFRKVGSKFMWVGSPKEEKLSSYIEKWRTVGERKLQIKN